MANSAKSGNWT